MVQKGDVVEVGGFCRGVEGVPSLRMWGSHSSKQEWGCGILAHENRNITPVGEIKGATGEATKEYGARGALGASPGGSAPRHC